MALQRYQPASLLQQFNDEINRMFLGQIEPVASGPTAQWRPAIDVHESSQAYVIEAEVPGIAPSDIEITLRNGELTLSGERIYAHESKDGETAQNGREGSRHVERHYGRFARRFTLPDSADEEAIEAHSEQGVLRITVPKKAQSQPRQIEVQQG